MKVINSNSLKDEIRLALVEKCNARSLDDEQDFEAVMHVIEGIVNKWLDNRCAGCK